MQRWVLGWVTAGLVMTGPVMAEGTPPETPVQSGAVHARSMEMAAALVSQMTLDEKIGQLVNVAPAIPRLNVPAYNWWTESLHGALGPVPTTNFPAPIGLASTFDDALIHDVAADISEEVRGLHALARQTGRLGTIGSGLDTWSPNINIFRDPRWGRGQETYGEDPFLTARLAVAYVRGMQGPDPELPDVISTPKHFAVHSGPESTRHSANVFVTPHDLEDTYLPAFRAAIVEGRAGSIMCAYNRVDGQPACASDLLLRQKLRGAWKFDGYVVSDCDAVKDIADNHHYASDPAAAVAVALKAGVDNECHVGTLFAVVGLEDRYKEAYDRGLLSMSDIDTALVRLFAARFRNGDLPGLAGRADKPAPSLAVSVKAHAGLALKTATESMVLLKNDGILPFNNGWRIALIGPHGDSTRVLRGNYSSRLSAPPISVLDGMRHVFGNFRVRHFPFSPSPTDGDPIPTSALRTPKGQPGLQAQYFNSLDASHPPQGRSMMESIELSKHIAYSDKPLATRVEPGVARLPADISGLTHYHRTVWSGFVTPPESGSYRIGLAGAAGELDFNGKVVAKPDPAVFSGLPSMTTVTLEKGKRYPVRLVNEGRSLSSTDLVWKRVSSTPEEDLSKAAKDVDVIVAVVGLTADMEGEEMKVNIEGFSGGDKTSLDLPSDQRHLLEAAKATGKPLVVVLLNGSPIDLSWAKDNASAIVEAWYPGEEGGLAVAQVLSGKVDPAGRLPLTFYRSVADLPPFDNYSMQGRTYRYFKGTAVYPFGFGLSYGSFSYGPVKVEALQGSAGNGVRVTTEVTNTGSRQGDEVAELYLTPPPYDGAPRVALRAFRRLHLSPGEHQSVVFELSPRDLSFVTRDGVRQVMQGTYDVSVGSGQPGTGVAVQAAQFASDKVIAVEE